MKTQLTLYFILRLIFFLFSVFIMLSGCDEQEVKQKNDARPSLIISHIQTDGAFAITLTVTVLTVGIRKAKEYGIVYSESSGPTIKYYKVSYSKTREFTFTTTIGGLKINTTYFFRAYHIAEDNTITYSNEASMKTMLHELWSFSPISASITEEVTIMGANFEPGMTRLYLNDVRTDAKVTNSAIKFFVPFGWQTDSLTITVEMGGQILEFPKKLHHKKGRWTKVRSYADLDQQIGSYFSGLEILGKGYITGAFDFLSKNVIREYNPLSEEWTELTTFPEPAITYVKWFAFEVFIFCVSTNDNEFWVYDLEEDRWNEFGWGPIDDWSLHNGIAFGLQGKGYIGLGLTEDKSCRELWRFDCVDPAGWIRVSDFPGQGVASPLVLTTSLAAYVIGGADGPPGESVYCNEMWKYDPVIDTWEEKSPYPGLGVSLNGFVLNDKLYAGGGRSANNTTTYYDDFWEYDPATDKWKRVADLPVFRELMYSFSFEDSGYLGSGQGPSNGAIIWHHDLWKFEIN